jgi:hypothetical protein
MGIVVLGLVSLSGIAGAAQSLSATMTGTQEVPPNTSGGGGACTATVDTTTLMVTFGGSFSGLTAPASAASLRGLAPAGSVGAVLLPQTSLTPATAGTFSGSGTLTPLQVRGVLAGETYCEIDDPAFPSGEIRGQLRVPPPVPALPPHGVAIVAVVLAGIGSQLLLTRRRATNVR